MIPQPSRWLASLLACVLLSLPIPRAVAQEHPLATIITLGAPIPTEPTPVSPPEKIGPPKQSLPQLLPPVTPESKAEASENRSAWFDHPIPRANPRPGFFPMPPRGGGYYSLWDYVMGEFRENPPRSGYVPHALMSTPFFETDWRYVDDPKSRSQLWERLHRIHLDDNWLLGTGGEYTWRHAHEFNSRLSGRTNDYDLFRGRVYGDLWYRDAFRIYGEFISAGTANQDLPPLPIDEDRADIQNLFIDVKLGMLGTQPLYVRAGRQELLFGSQRLISPPDWANTRRTFQGVRMFRTSENFDLDLFWVNPVVPDNSRFNSIDHLQNFYGAWSTYRPNRQQAFDFYYLFLDNANPSRPGLVPTSPTSVHTLGTRYAGDQRSLLWDFEIMAQFGDRGGDSIHAGSATGGLGYNFTTLPMNPTVWAYYDWASGTHHPNSGRYNTFNQLFPFGHYYFGWLDLVGRQNISDWNMHLYLHPVKWMTFNAQYHILRLDSATDALYNAAGTPIRLSPNGSAGGKVGQELDLIINFHLSPRSNFLTGYSRLNAGEFLSNTGSGRSPELFYLMYNFRW